MEKNLDLFQREALASRKRDGKEIDPPWLPEYLDGAYYPTIKDVNRKRPTAPPVFLTVRSSSCDFHTGMAYENIGITASVLA